MNHGQFAYVASTIEQRREYSSTSTWNDTLQRYENDSIPEPRIIASWEHHVNLHQWMYQLYKEKGYKGDFLDDDLELSWDDVDRLEKDLKQGKLRDNWKNGVMFGVNFFDFGTPTDDINYEYDLDFCVNAKAELFFGLKVFYTNIW